MGIRMPNRTLVVVRTTRVDSMHRVLLVLLSAAHALAIYVPPPETEPILNSSLPWVNRSLWSPPYAAQCRASGKPCLGLIGIFTHP